MNLVFFPRQPARQQRHHMLGAAPAQVRDQQEDSGALRHGFPERKQLSPNQPVHCVFAITDLVS